MSVPKLFPNISEHLLYSILKDDANSIASIVSSISRMNPDEISEFLMKFCGITKGFLVALERCEPKVKRLNEKITKELKTFPIQDYVNNGGYKKNGF